MITISCEKSKIYKPIALGFLTYFLIRLRITSEIITFKAKILENPIFSRRFQVNFAKELF